MRMDLQYAIRLFGKMLFALFLLFAPSYGQSPYDNYRAEIQEYPGVCRITVTTPDGKPATQEITLYAVGQLERFGIGADIRSEKLVIPAGKTSAETTLSLGRGNVDLASRFKEGFLWLEEDNNGRYDRRRDFFRLDIDNIAIASSDESEPMLFVSSNVSSVDSKVVKGDQGNFRGKATSLGFAAPEQLPSFIEYRNAAQPSFRNTFVNTSASTMLQLGAGNVHCIQPDNFFTSWGHLTEFRSLLISTKDLHRLSKTEAALTALKQWVAVGGQLIVSDLQAGFSERGEIMDLLGLPSDQKNQHWQQPNQKFLDLQLPYRPAQQFLTAGVAKTIKYDTETEPPFLIRDYLQGRILLISGGLSSWREQQWRDLLHCFRENSVISTFGKESAQNFFKQDFVIPGIGDPPIVAFQVLITGFVILVGPCFYFFFHRSKRLYMLLIAAPVLSTCAVCSLLLYAIINDGLGIRGRVQSVSVIDHSNQAGYVHARHCYYSGVSLKPSQFERGTFVCDAAPDGASSPTLRRTSDDFEWLSGGQMIARTQFQLTALQCIETDKTITFSMGADNDQGVLTNAYGHPFELIVLRRGSAWYAADSVQTESTAICKKMSISNVQDLAATCIRRLRTRTSNRREAISVYNFFYSDLLDFSGWGQTTRVVQTLANHGSIDRILDADGYLAISTTSELMDYPQPQALFEGNQLHVTIGKW